VNIGAAFGAIRRNQTYIVRSGARLEDYSLPAKRACASAE